MVRTCLVQNISKQDMLSYAGVTVKYIMGALQRLVVILPIESRLTSGLLRRRPWLAAFTVLGNKSDKAHGEVVLNTTARALRANLLSRILKARSEFKDLAEEWSREVENRPGMQGFSNIKSAEGEVCFGMCGHCC